MTEKLKDDIIYIADKMGASKWTVAPSGKAIRFVIARTFTTITLDPTGIYVDSPMHLEHAWMDELVALGQRMRKELQL